MTDIQIFAQGCHSLNLGHSQTRSSFLFKFCHFLIIIYKNYFIWFDYFRERKKNWQISIFCGLSVLYQQCYLPAPEWSSMRIIVFCLPEFYNSSRQHNVGSQESFPPFYLYIRLPQSIFLMIYTFNTVQPGYHRVKWREIKRSWNVNWSNFKKINDGKLFSDYLLG